MRGIKSPAHAAAPHEVAKQLAGRGRGWTDVHLLAAFSHFQLSSRDRRLADARRRLQLAFTA